MKVKSNKNPYGFDYAGIVQVLEAPLLKLPSEPTTIEVQCDYPSTECGHMTTLCIPEQRAFLGFDLLYNRAHAWCGPGVEKAEIHNWIQALSMIQRKTEDGDWTLYSGHGSEGKKELIWQHEVLSLDFPQGDHSREKPRGGNGKHEGSFPRLRARRPFAGA